MAIRAPDGAKKEVAVFAHIGTRNIVYTCQLVPRQKSPPDIIAKTQGRHLLVGIVEVMCHPRLFS